MNIHCLTLTSWRRRVVLFRAGASLITRCIRIRAVGNSLLDFVCLPSFAFVAYERAISSALTCSLQRGLSLCNSILVWYGTEDAFECMDDSLELLLEGDADLPLGMSMSMSISILAGIWAIRLVDRALVVVESVIFADSLMGATMQDGGKRERSNGPQLFTVTPE